MNDGALGQVVRSLRIRLQWRQVDLARRASVSPSTVARIERGLVRGVSVDRLRRVLEALGARLDLVPRWNGGDLDRLLKSRHSAMHQMVAERFTREAGWELTPEVSFSIYGERGILDGLAWHASTRTVLVIELKSEIVDINDLMGKGDQRRRLAPRIAALRGWSAATHVGLWVVAADSRTNRRRLATHRSVLRAAFPSDGRSIGAWLRRPSGPIAALSFLSDHQAVTLGRGIAPTRRVHARMARTPRDSES